MKPVVVRFGYWPVMKDVMFSGERIQPIEGLRELIAEVNATTYSKNDLMHPPVHKLTRSSDNKNWTEVPHSEHGAELYHWDATHTFELAHPVESPLNDFETNPTFFLLQCLAYIEGVRCIPEEWWFFGKLPLKNVSNAHFKSIGDALDKCFQTWTALPVIDRLHLTNTLQFYNSIVGFKFFWERFSHEHSAFDACWRLRYPGNVVNGTKVDGHPKRIKAMLDDLKIKYDEVHIRSIVKARNDLIHELSWSGENFLGRSGTEGLRYAFDLRRMNHRIIGRLLGMSGAYFESPFTSIGIMYVDLVH